MCSFAESGESEIQCLVGIMELAALQHVLPCAAGLLDIGISRLEHSLPNDTVLSWEYLQDHNNSMHLSLSLLRYH